MARSGKREGRWLTTEKLGKLLLIPNQRALLIPYQGENLGNPLLIAHPKETPRNALLVPHPSETLRDLLLERQEGKTNSGTKRGPLRVRHRVEIGTLRQKKMWATAILRPWPKGWIIQ